MPLTCKICSSGNNFLEYDWRSNWSKMMGDGPVDMEMENIEQRLLEAQGERVQMVGYQCYAVFLNKSYDNDYGY